MAQNNQSRRIINNDDDVYESNRNPVARSVENCFYQFLVKYVDFRLKSSLNSFHLIFLLILVLSWVLMMKITTSWFRSTPTDSKESRANTMQIVQARWRRMRKRQCTSTSVIWATSLMRILSSLRISSRPSTNLSLRWPRHWHDSWARTSSQRAYKSIISS